MGLPAAPRTSRAGAVSFGLAALLAAGLLYYSLRGIEWRQIARIAAGASPGRVVVAAALGTAAIFLRAWRWRLPLHAEGAGGVGTAFWATPARYIAHNFPPARARARCL